MLVRHDDVLLIVLEWGGGVLFLFEYLPLA